MTPSGTSPQATNFHKATSNLRASATIILYGFFCLPRFSVHVFSSEPFAKLSKVDDFIPQKG